MNLKEQVTLLVHKHEKEITTLREEVNRLIIIINTINAGLLKDIPKEAVNTKSIGESETCKSAESEAADDNYKPGFSCVECNYRCEKEITLKKHCNTKHLVRNKTCDEGQESALKAKFFCDECSFSCSTKKSLNNHKTKEHNAHKTLQESNDKDAND